VSHGGAWGGYRSELLRFPTQHLSVVTLCNRGDAQPRDLSKMIAERFLAGKLAAEPVPAEKKQAAAAGRLSAAELAELAGLYVDEAEGEIRRYAVQGDHLQLEMEDVSFPLESIGPRELRIVGRPGGRIHHFEAAPGGGLRLSLIDPDGTAMVFERLKPAKAKLEEYAGEYLSDELAAAYRMVVGAGGLGARVRDRPPMSGTAVAEDLFAFRDGLVRFDRDGKGRITAFRWLVRGGALRFVRR
jgi:hypothetical protein